MSATSRPLTPAEHKLAASVFGDAIDYDRVRIHHRKWFPFQPKKAIMAPDGHLWVNPNGELWSDDYGTAPINLRALFIHEMTHVWQAQKRGKWYLVLMRHPLCRYSYCVRAGQPFERYGLEQQAEIARHTFLAQHGFSAPGMPSLATLKSILPFKSR